MVKYARNELLRALDLRLTALKEEILILLNRAVGSNLSTREISDLSAFVQRFGTSEFRYVKKHSTLQFHSFFLYNQRVQIMLIGYNCVF
jgi:hypothetical protein